MMTKYLIHCVRGSGGMFLMSIFSKLMGFTDNLIISKSGHCHDFGNGIWNGNKNINFIGEFWDLNFKKNKTFFYTHVLDVSKFKKMMPDVKLVLINYSEIDYHNITKMFVSKAWPDTWNVNEYNKWKGDLWPPFSKDNLTNELVLNDIIRGLTSLTARWIAEIHYDNYDYIIDYRTIMGLNDLILDQEVSRITGYPTNEYIHQHVLHYQRLNNTLYLNA